MGTRGGAGTFGGGRTTQTENMRVLSTRRIGLSDAGQALPILGGTRLSGRQGAYSVGVLNIQQREDQGVAATNFSALRLKRDVLANSDIGAVVLDKEVNGPSFNRLAGMDANFRFGNLIFNGFGAKSFSPATAIASKKGNELSSRAGVDYRNRQWRVNAKFTTVGERFNDELGFIPRLGVNEMNGQINRTL